MSKNLLKCLEELKEVASSKSPYQRRKVLKQLSKRNYIYLALKEIAKNTIKRNIPLNNAQVKKILKHRKVIKGLTCKTKGKIKRQRLVNQSGGFIQAILPALASLLGTLLIK